MKQKSTKIWIILLVAPVIVLVATSILQLLVRFAFNSSAGGESAVVTIINIISILAGMVAIIGLLGMPIWIVMLILVMNHNSKLQSSISLPQQPVTSEQDSSPSSPTSPNI